MRPLGDQAHCLNPDALVLGRRNVDQVERVLRVLQVEEGIGVPHLGFVGESRRVQVVLDGRDGLSAGVQEDAVRGTLAESLDANAAGSAEEIEHCYAGQRRA